MRLHSLIVATVLLSSCSNKPEAYQRQNSKSSDAKGESKCGEGDECASDSESEMIGEESEPDDELEKESAKDPTPEPELSPEKKPEVKAPAPQIFEPEVQGLVVKGKDGKAPTKGTPLVFTLDIANKGEKPGKFSIQPLLSSSTFSDYSNIEIPKFEINLKGKEKKSQTFELSVFFSNPANKKEYALGQGNYSIALKIAGNEIESKTLKDFKGNGFDVAKSNVVFNAVFWDKKYLEKAKYSKGIENWLNETFTRLAESSDEARILKTFKGGFDEMMGIKNMSRAYEGFVSSESISGSDSGGLLGQVSDYGKKVLGLNQAFAHSNSRMLTNKDNHGFDFAIGLTPRGFGGWAAVGGNLSISGIFDSDTSIGRAQMILIHELSHNYGAGHCNGMVAKDIYLMCSGELHPNYMKNGSFVWHKVSLDVMLKSQSMNANAAAIASIGSEEEITVSDSCYGPH